MQLSGRVHDSHVQGLGSVPITPPRRRKGREHGLMAIGNTLQKFAEELLKKLFYYTQITYTELVDLVNHS